MLRNSIFNPLGWGKAQSWPAPVPMGVLVQNDFNAANWDIIGSPGATFAGDGITIVNSAGVLTNIIKYKHYTNLDKCKVTFTIAVTNANPNFIFGLLGRQAIINNGGSYQNTGSNQSAILWTQAAVPPISITHVGNPLTVLAVPAASTLIISIAWNGSNVTITKQVNGGAVGTQNFDLRSYSNTGTHYPSPGMSSIFCMPINCNMKITSFVLDSIEDKNVPMLAIGDSITQCAYAGSNAGRWATLIGADINANESGFTSDALLKMPQLLLKNAQKVFLKLGINDKSIGIPDATWQANYVSIVSQLEAAGTTVVKLTYGGGGSNGTFVNNWIKTQYPTSHIDTGLALNSVPGTLNALYDSGDNIHPNAAGNIVEANTIMASPLY